MPHADANGIRLYYELAGQGTPLVLVEGIGYASWMWLHQRQALGARHQLLIYDNRDVGQSAFVTTPYTIDDMAADLAGLLDVLGIERAHVLGISMGGFIAQAFALAYPRRVWGLALAATHVGGREAVPIPPETLRVMGPDPSVPPLERLRNGMAMAFAPEYLGAHPEALDELVAIRLRSPQPAEAWLRQAAASKDFATAHMLPRLTMPTLILHGDQDRVVPVANARLLAGYLPRAELQVLPGGGHLVFLEQPERFNALVLDFLARVEKESTGGN